MSSTSAPSLTPSSATVPLPDRSGTLHGGSSHHRWWDRCSAPAGAGAGSPAVPAGPVWSARGPRRSHRPRRGWAKLLMVKDNDRAVEMAKRFEAGEADYQTDIKWWELAQEADAEVLTGIPGSGSTGGAVLGDDDDQDDTLGDTLAKPNADGAPSNGSTNAQPVIAPVRVPVPSLTDVFQGDSQHPRFEVRSFAVQPNDPALNHTRAPWSIRKTTSGHWEFFVVPTHSIFRSATMTPLDALITQLAWQARDLTHDHGEETPFVEFLFALREKYNVKSKLDPAALSAESLAQLADAATSVVGRVPADVLRSFFEDCGPSLQDRIRLAMAQRGASNPQGAISDGRFLQYAPPRTIADFILVNPEHFFDGTYWIDEYSTLDFGSGVATEEARKRVLSYYASLLADTVWLAEQGVEELGNCSRERLLRASLATALIAPTAQSVTQ